MSETTKQPTKHEKTDAARPFAGTPDVPIVRVREATMMTMAADEWRRLRRIEAAAVWCLGYLAEAPRKTSTMRDVEDKLAGALDDTARADMARERASQDGAVANG